MPVQITAQYQVRLDSLAVCKAAISEFVEAVRNEPGTLEYVAWQEVADPTRFLHHFVFKDRTARDRHATSEAVKRFTGILYANIVAPVQFTEYEVIASTLGRSPRPGGPISQAQGPRRSRSSRPAGAPDVQPRRTSR
ncbi:MAG: antibiotic biosynthesis monooxygenase [Chloroflexi bacterium]|nr:antibiotic biosynthesis monooxygenase [Chloroflexota bacterium]